MILYLKIKGRCKDLQCQSCINRSCCMNISFVLVQNLLCFNFDTVFITIFVREVLVGNV